jgi:hypothetical protein
MPVTRVGDWCQRCGIRAAQPVLGVCRPCELLTTAFGHPPVGVVVLDYRSTAFSLELNRWRQEAA